MRKFTAEESRELMRIMQVRSKRPSLRGILLGRAKETFPFPPNPFCSSTVSSSLVREVLEEAGYTNFKLFIAKDGIYIEPKKEGA